MAIMRELKSLLGKKRSLNKVPLDELRREQIRLEQEEHVYTRRIDEVEKRKETLFVNGKDETSQRRQVIMARKIKTLDAEARNMQKHLQLFAYQARVINGLVQIKDNQRILKDMGVSGLLSSLNLEELELYVEQATVDGKFHLERFGQVIRGMEDQQGSYEDAEDEEDIRKIVEAMNAAQAAETTNPEQAVADGLRMVEDALHEPDQSEAY